jgi:hypothetical protein
MYACMCWIATTYPTQELAAKAFCFLRRNLWQQINEIRKLASRRLLHIPPLPHPSQWRTQTAYLSPWIPFLPYLPPPLRSARCAPAHHLLDAGHPISSVPQFPAPPPSPRCRCPGPSPVAGRRRPERQEMGVPVLMQVTRTRRRSVLFPTGNPASPLTGSPTSSSPATQFHLLQRFPAPPPSPRGRRPDPSPGAGPRRPERLETGAPVLPQATPHSPPSVPVISLSQTSLVRYGFCTWRLVVCIMHVLANSMNMSWKTNNFNIYLVKKNLPTPTINHKL